MCDGYKSGNLMWLCYVIIVHKQKIFRLGGSQRRRQISSSARSTALLLTYAPSLGLEFQVEIFQEPLGFSVRRAIVNNDNLDILISTPLKGSDCLLEEFWIIEMDDAHRHEWVTQLQTRVARRVLRPVHGDVVPKHPRLGLPVLGLGGVLLGDRRGAQPGRQSVGEPLSDRLGGRLGEHGAAVLRRDELRHAPDVGGDERNPRDEALQDGVGGVLGDHGEDGEPRAGPHVVEPRLRVHVLLDAPREGLPLHAPGAHIVVRPCAQVPRERQRLVLGHPPKEGDLDPPQNLRAAPLDAVEHVAEQDEALAELQP
mmetsp:Transcript_29645/g.70668  ORF Transcript_29645/g.70668 Transcript_29645/m.70668 type:complete len:312 (-) Transcript_29645:508-1443(-)